MEVNGQGIEDVDQLVYLGATVSKEGGGTQDIQNREVKVRGIFMRSKKIWSTNSIRQGERKGWMEDLEPGVDCCS